MGSPERHHLQRRSCSRIAPISVRWLMRSVIVDGILSSTPGRVAPRVIGGENARVLLGHVDRYAYISSGSVYQWGGLHVDETSPVVAASATSDDYSDYASAKRGGAELAVLESFPDALLARQG